MTALDPSPVLTCRREALDRLDHLREAAAEFLDRPTSSGLASLTATLQGFVQFETDEVLTADALADFSLEQVDQLGRGHSALSSQVNLLSWAVPGSADAQTQVHQLRHEVLAHIDRYHALRLPRGTVIPSS
jgi:hypothetical protein